MVTDRIDLVRIIEEVQRSRSPEAAKEAPKDAAGSTGPSEVPAEEVIETTVVETLPPPPLPNNFLHESNVPQVSSPDAGYQVSPGQMVPGFRRVSPAANDHRSECSAIAPYEILSEQLQSRELSRNDQPLQPVTDPTADWWVAQAIQPTSQLPSIHFALDQIIEGALQFSSKIRIVTFDPAIARTEFKEEVAQFNWRSFWEMKYDRLNDPVGNSLTTGDNSTRFFQDMGYLDGGLRKRNRLGGELEVSQRLQYLDNNSRFQIPNPQGTTRLQMQYTQPLLNGKGRAVNESRIVLASIQVGVMDDQWILEVQDHLVLVTEAYWNLYQARVDYLLWQELLRKAVKVEQRLAGRMQFDGLQRQMLRARSAIASRESDLIRAAAEIRNSEARLRVLINDPVLMQRAGDELTTCEAPREIGCPLSIGESVRLALLNRRDISAAIRDVNSAGVRTGVAKNELLPKLDLMLSSYVAGLEGRGNFGPAFVNQFTEGAPGVAMGLVFEAPVGNQAAEARMERQRLEMMRAITSLDWVVQQAFASVEIATRTVETAYREISARRQAMVAAKSEVDYLQDRWETLAGQDDLTAVLLENLLEAQQRQTNEERLVVRAQVEYVLALVNLKREMGILVRAGTP